ncbi:MAG: nicotinate-nucleotide--dimethylbenzimidazole phosphoribosyltransferase [Acidobacteriaceae bacterium]|nr:nicotinate-nucleotide--dimethylbenzimidazole phosphoribosyltransferase [Acidobacteriaceae bacterium]MBV8572489.1 nicotinate-nucleotide--dimethylbenzimidazole phosphoribosyltransferase [Acidobacteriaceae bacterium]
MKWEEFQALLSRIEPADRDWFVRAQSRQDHLTKPPGSLGRLEEIANRICGMQRTLEPQIENPAILIFAADNGVCEEGVNPFPQSVTRQMVANFLADGAAINALAGSVGASLTVVDVGVLGEPLDHPMLVSRRTGPGTRNFSRGPAMSHEEVMAAVSAGVEIAGEAVRCGSTLLAVGEMGIGNSTVASAICAAMTNSDPATVCGRGTGSDELGLARKREVVARALALHREFLTTPLNLLARLGGFEIAAMCGAYLRAAERRVPVIVDGFISAAAAAIAVSMNDAVRDYLIAGHQSAEPGHVAFLRLLNLQPLLQLDMRLGEGTGAALAIPVVRAALAAFRSMKTFESAGVAESTVSSFQ